MQYTVAAKPEKHNGGKFFPHVFEFNIAHQRAMSLPAEIEERYGPKGERWRFTARYDYRKRAYVVILRFVDKDDALNYRLSFNEDEIKADPNFGLSRFLHKLKLNSQYGSLGKSPKLVLKAWTPSEPLDRIVLLEPYPALEWFKFKIPTRLEKIQRDGHVVISDINALIKERLK
jgi:hypothetical protein